MFKEQSLDPSVLLAQTKPKGFAANKTRWQGDCSYYNTTHVNCVNQRKHLKEGLLLAKGVYPILLRGFLIG